MAKSLSECNPLEEWYYYGEVYPEDYKDDEQPKLREWWKLELEHVEGIYYRLVSYGITEGEAAGIIESLVAMGMREYGG